MGGGCTSPTWRRLPRRGEQRGQGEGGERGAGGGEKRRSPWGIPESGKAALVAGGCVGRVQIRASGVQRLEGKRKRGERFLGLAVRLSPETVWILPAPSLPLQTPEQPHRREVQPAEVDKNHKHEGPSLKLRAPGEEKEARRRKADFESRTPASSSRADLRAIRAARRMNPPESGRAWAERAGRAGDKIREP